MALNGLILDDRNNTSKNWRNIFARIMKDGIIRNGCEITFTSNSITVGGGYFIQKGTVIENDGAETIPVIPTLTDGYVRLICRVDLTKEAAETGPGQTEWATDFSATSTFPALVQEDILSTGSVYEIEFAVLQITGGNITGITRQIGDAEIDAERLGGQLPAYYATKEDVDAKVSKSGDTVSGDLFFDNAGIFPTQTGQGLIGSTTYKWDGIYANRISAYEGLACLGTLALDKTQVVPVSTLTYVANHVYRFGTWVFVDIACRHAENGIPSSGAIGTLPAGYRPPAGLDCAMGIAAKADGSIYLVHIIVQTNGVIYVVDQTGGGPYKWAKAFLTLSTV